MNKTLKFYSVVLVLIFVGIIAIEQSVPEPIDWTQTYSEKDKIPFGTFVLYNELPNLFPESKIRDVEVTPYEYFIDYYSFEDSTYLTTGNYINIRQNHTIDEISAQELLDFAYYGNAVFLSSNNMPQAFIDSLGIRTKIDYELEGTAEFSLANPAFKSDSITIEKGISNVYFQKIDTLNSTVLGYQKFDSINRVNFIKVAHGDGHVYLHTQPMAFTNYQLLKADNKKYAAAVLSYLPNDSIYFDAIRKSIVRNNNLNSPLRFIFSNPALKWAWSLALLSLFCFMIFNAKRKQRIVQVIKPLKNTTIDFAKTIANLYFDTQDHNNLIEKKTTYFLEYLRRTYFINTEVLDEHFIKQLSQKSGKPITLIKKLVDLIAHLKAKQNCNEDDLLRLNKLIEEFYN
ncbi:MAG: hypothetical protein BM564_05730 [Bacteroidetes bacterium MedPE-SWsnd-G2]|nr:MAG: hypothetical protein BM564_05730 [Bacteroidetes bacterium MedPE-SWsnd-G2]